MKKLDIRLQTVADLTDRGRALADIGTDHGALPIYLIQKDWIPFAIASDVREGPLSHARKAVMQAGLEEKIDLRLSDGLDAIDETEADCIVMAGMGGILITQLIGKAPWLCNPGKSLVLQPMSDVPLVRRYLAETGFAVKEERGASDRHHAYVVLKAAYNGCCHPLSLLEAMVGRLPEHMGEHEKQFLAKESAGLRKQIQGLTVTGQKKQARDLQEVYEAIQLLIMKGA